MACRLHGLASPRPVPTPPGTPRGSHLVTLGAWGLLLAQGCLPGWGGPSPPTPRSWAAALVPGTQGTCVALPSSSQLPTLPAPRRAQRGAQTGHGHTGPASPSRSSWARGGAVPPAHQAQGGPEDLGLHRVRGSGWCSPRLPRQEGGSAREEDWPSRWPAPGARVAPGLVPRLRAGRPGDLEHWSHEIRAAEEQAAERRPGSRGEAYFYSRTQAEAGAFPGQRRRARPAGLQLHTGEHTNTQPGNHAYQVRPAPGSSQGHVERPQEGATRACLAGGPGTGSGAKPRRGPGGNGGYFPSTPKLTFRII